MKTTSIGKKTAIRSIVLAGIAASLAAFFVTGGKSAEAFATVTWDGGGTTNNWSEAANWTDDTVPGAGDDVTFDATSTKNVTIDTSINVGSIAIAVAYTGTITQSNSASITVTGCSGRFCFEQRGGTFNGSTNTITLNSAGFGALRMLGGTFNGGSGDISLPNGPSFGADLALQGGTFKSTSGTLTVAGLVRYQNAGTVFLHNGGTVSLTAAQNQFLSNDSNTPTLTFNNLNISSAPGINYDFGPRIIVEGTLALNEGTIGQGNNGSVIEARGGFSVSPDFDGGIGRVEFGPAGSPRTITLVAGLTYPSLRLNDPNLTVNTSGSGTLVMPHQLNIAQGIFNQGNVDMTINSLGISGGPCLSMSGGTFNGSNKTITFVSDGFGTVFMTGGTFNGGSGDITATGDAPPDTNHDIQVNGGIFRSTSGTLFVSRAFRFQNGGVFQNNGGTVVFDSGTTAVVVSDDGMGNSPPIVFNNLTFNRDNGSILQLLATTLIVNGTLSMTDGHVDDGGGFRTIEARGDVNVASTFDGLAFRIKLLFSGSACQTVTLSGTQNFPGVWEASKTGCGITAAGNFGVGAVTVSNGLFTFGTDSHANIVGDMTIDPNGRVITGDNTAIDVGNGQIGGDLILDGNSGVINVSGSTSVSGNLTIDGPTGSADLGALTVTGSVQVGGLNNLVTMDSLTVDPAGSFTADGPSIITLAGNVVNSGLINLHDEESPNCTFGGFVTVQSSVMGTRRLWSGNGVFRMVHINAIDMGGTTPIHIHGGLNNSNNDVNWIFDGTCSARSIHTPADFDGDGKTDIGVFRPSTADWWINRSTLGLAVPRFGLTTDRPTQADFDGDGITDVAVWREMAQARFFIIESSTNTVRIEDFGIVGDDPGVVADWDGDGKADLAVYRPGNAGSFFFLGSKNNPNRNIAFVPWGTTGDRPVRGDFDGDGKEDAAVFRPSDGDWWVLRSSDLTPAVSHWGLASDRTIDGDFDGDGKNDLAVFRPSERFWFILQSSDGQARVLPFGLATDVLTPGDYDGDGKTDISIWRPSTGETWIINTSDGSVAVATFGAAGDIPLASLYAE